ncbi:hypothetical protein QRO08_03805 [Paracidovorax citrulli]|uniref:Uncharacterized protein n=2 Tax=Paracidovorax citrulli TaxID=80869 RepID=A1TR67_PARC0|nr:hypothetical protein [Paracidovorax citrulli]ABM33455.1 conserved hypothetical protein [Paracidovorax citrulli AAC00-1]ABM34637.1 conserved hypothetical protein [Paracidovorax citrulli AAC00-1]ATG92636.1 hypothetical protein CQB05_00050 [Paracidovorax citrulli]ATG94079.1 hypothetical protein CQB05_08600 [Paracidovorax citrulli]PVY62745.1 hypothetical protein C8E08_0006 [Paracidovorax citrulli]
MIYSYDSSMAGAPVLSGVAGAMRSVIKACLVDGFGAGAVSSLNVSSGVATAKFAAAHPYRIGTVVQIAGATPAALNGQQRVLSVASDSITFAAAGVVDGAASGTITHKVAAAGWQELFVGQLADTIVLQPTVPEATGCVLRINDTGSTTARVVGYESASDINTGTGPFPTAAQVGGGLYWPKSGTASSAARTWRCIASSRWLLLWIAPMDGATHGCLFAFGDVLSYRSADAYGCALFGAASADVTTTPAPVGGCLGYGHAGASGSGDVFVARAATALGGAIAAKKVAAHNITQGYSGTSGYNSNSYAYPSPVDFGLRLAPVEIAAGTALRGRLPGVYHCAQVLGDAFNSGDTVAGEGAFAGRTLLALRCGAPSAGLSLAGTVFIDLTGPWE